MTPSTTALDDRGRRRWRRPAGRWPSPRARRSAGRRGRRRRRSRDGTTTTSAAAYSAGSSACVRAPRELDAVCDAAGARSLARARSRCGPSPTIRRRTGTSSAARAPRRARRSPSSPPAGRRRAGAAGRRGRRRTRAGSGRRSTPCGTSVGRAAGAATSAATSALQAITQRGAARRGAPSSPRPTLRASRAWTLNPYGTPSRARRPCRDRRRRRGRSSRGRRRPPAPARRRGELGRLLLGGARRQHLDAVARAARRPGWRGPVAGLRWRRPRPARPPRRRASSSLSGKVSERRGKPLVTTASSGAEHLLGGRHERLGALGPVALEAAEGARGAPQQLRGEVPGEVLGSSP